MVFVFRKYDANIPQLQRPFCDICHTSPLNFMTNSIFLQFLTNRNQNDA